MIGRHLLTMEPIEGQSLEVALPPRGFEIDRLVEGIGDVVEA